MKLFAEIFGFLGGLVAKTSSTACWFSMLDEEETPESLL